MYPDMPISPDLHVDIRQGDLPALPSTAPRDVGVLIRIEDDLSIRITSPIGGACHLDATARTVTLDLTGATDAAAARQILLADMLPGLLCHRRGLLPVSASAVEIGGRAVLITGVSGAGKSMVAAELVSRGHRLVADGVVAISTRPGAAPGAKALVLPGIPGLTLRDDAAARLTGRLATARPARRLRAEIPRDRHYPSAQTVASLPLAAIFHLHQTHAGPPLELTPVRGMAAFTTLETSIRQLQEGRILRQPQPIFAALSTLLAQVAVFVLHHRRDWSAPVIIADRIEAVMSDRSTS